MQKLSLLSLVAIALIAGGCKSEHEKVMSNMVDKTNEVVSVLKTITDADSAKAAGPKLKALGEEMKKLGEQAKAMKDPSPEDEKKLKEKYEAKLTAAMQGLMGEMMRIGMNPQLNTPEVQAALGAMK